MPAEASGTTPRRVGSRRYALAFVAATLVGLFATSVANKAYAPEMYATGGMIPAANAHAKGLNYAVFDLNLNIRALRDAQLARMTKTPDIIIIGASHWQESHKELLKGRDIFNAHIHRDYWEDLLGMVELLVKHDKLPRKLIFSLRDKQFTPVDDRKDWLWEPGIPAYRAMARRLGLEPESYLKTAPYDRARALISLPMLFENVTRWHNAAEHPMATDQTHFQSLDVLLPDGSILWSEDHKNIFTQERARRESNAFAQAAISDPPRIDAKGVAAFGKVLDFLKGHGVKVYFVQPPFNPVFYDRVQGTPYMDGLNRLDDLTRRIAAERGIPVFGSFNPHRLGCTADQYIDAEHANPKCLQHVWDEFIALEAAEGKS
ncbi:MAG: hypothetical protein JNM45_03745 [Rhizobiales bacterium]|nr:hypothetical protein [Hyphomicrobiales bacterium]